MVAAAHFEKLPHPSKFYWDPSDCNSLGRELRAANLRLMAHSLRLPLSSPPSIPLPCSPQCASPPAVPDRSPFHAAIAAPTNYSPSGAASPNPTAAAPRSRSTRSDTASRNWLPAVSPPPARPLSASPHFFLVLDFVAAPSPADHSSRTRSKPLPPAILPAATQFATPAAYSLPATESPVASAPGSAPRAPAATPSSTSPAAVSA